MLEYNRDRLYDRYLKWKAKEFNSRQIILNLQNNPLGNMAAIQDVMNAMAPLLAREEPYWCRSKCEAGVSGGNHNRRYTCSRSGSSQAE